MLSGFGLNLKGSISAPLGEKKMRKGFKLKKKKKQAHQHADSSNSLPNCKVLSRDQFTGFVAFFRNKFQGLFQDFSRTQIEPHKPFHS